MRFPKNVSTPFTAQRTPRVAARSDRPTLALHDAGHGQDPTTRNPILYGLGVTLNIQLDPFVRSWVAYVRAYDPISSSIVSEDITSEFARDGAITNRYKLSGPIGVFPLGNSNSEEDDYEDTQRIEIIVESTNADLSTTQVFELYVKYGDEMSHCPSAEDCDFSVFSPLSKAGIRIFENFNDRDNVANLPVSFFFETMDALLAAVPELASVIPGHSPEATVGIEFGNSGVCGPRSGGSAPNCGTLRCCCEIQESTITTEMTNISDGGATVTPGSAVALNDVIEVFVTIPTRGSAYCIGFESLIITIPGRDTTSGYWDLDCPPPNGTYAPIVQQNGNPIAPVFTQDGVVGGTGSFNHATLDFTGISIACGDEITIRFRVTAALVTPSNGVAQTIGPLEFSDGGPCNPDMSTSLPTATIIED